MIDLLWLVPFLPLLGATINGIVGSRLPRAAVNAFALGSTGLSFVIAVGAFLNLVGMPQGERLFEQNLFTWISSGDFRAEAGLQLDPLSGTWMLIVTGIGFLIHLYSTGYMSHDKSYWRFFTYLNLFMFSMLVLVLGNNFLLMFIGWEGVGLCSYLLIGYDYDRVSAADAGKKAFIMNRVGDFGFILGIFGIFTVFGSIDYTDVFHKVPETIQYNSTVITLITLALFLGATGKSAQLPLYTWLPDAMEGPTPVSALIHAATMVTAGVYMVARCNSLFSMSPDTLAVVAIIGAATALFAATIGLFQKDIKRVLAYSTVSQLGYMFLACGVGAYVAGVFHVMTHAFFKACLFLGSGSVIHALSGEQNMEKMGGLKSEVPQTYMTFFISTLAIAGIFPLAGFFSKDEILWETFSSGHMGLYLVVLFGAGITAFYMFRLVFMTFYGESRVEEEAKHHLHESPPVMTIPLWILAAGAVFSGFLGIPLIEGANVMHNFLGEVFTHGAPAVHAAASAAGAHDVAAVGHEVISGAATAAHGAAEAAPAAHAAAGGHHNAGLEIGMMLLSLAVALTGIGLAYYFYYLRPKLAEKMAADWPTLHNVIYNKYFVDEIYDAVITNPIVAVSRSLLWKFFDVMVVDGIVNGVASLSLEMGRWTRAIHTGVVRNYAFMMLAGAAVMLGYYFLS